jgi:predicted membrane protein
MIMIGDSLTRAMIDFGLNTAFEQSRLNKIMAVLATILVIRIYFWSIHFSLR